MSRQVLSYQQMLSEDQLRSMEPALLNHVYLECRDRVHVAAAEQGQDLEQGRLILIYEGYIKTDGGE